MRQIAEEVITTEIGPDFDLEIDFDDRTMYCEADVSEMTGWNAQLIEQQVRSGAFPKPMNGNLRAPVWSRSTVDAHYLNMIHSLPDALELEKIERHRDIYNQTYQEMLDYEKREPLFASIFGEREARWSVEQNLPNHLYGGEDEYEVSAFRETLYEESLAGAIERYAELMAKWKARQAVRWRSK